MSVRGTRGNLQKAIATGGDTALDAVQGVVKDELESRIVNGDFDTALGISSDLEEMVQSTIEAEIEHAIEERLEEERGEPA